MFPQSYLPSKKEIMSLPLANEQKCLILRMCSGNHLPLPATIIGESVSPFNPFTFVPLIPKLASEGF